jgi:hypothetical protein
MQSAPKMNHALIITIVVAAVYSVAFSQSALAVCRECAPVCRMGPDGRATCQEVCKTIDCPSGVRGGSLIKQQQTGTKAPGRVSSGGGGHK